MAVLKEMFVILLSVLHVRTQWDLDEDECRLPPAVTDGCIPIHQCHTITNLLEAVANGNSELSTSAVQFLRSYQCGFQGDSIKVCCPKETLFPKSVLNRFDGNEPRPPNVRNHRNLRLLPYECGMPQSSDRISGGTKALLGEFPWMVLINYSTGKGFGFKCGGTIINNRYILTAAHCLTNLGNLKPVDVRVGEYNTSSSSDCEFYSNGVKHCAPPVQDIQIEEVIPHADFNPAEYINDIGLLRLSTTINTRLENAKPICLPLSDSKLNQNFTNTKLTITGWGLTEIGKTSDTLLRVNIPILSRSECQQAYQRISTKISHLHLCGGGRDRQESCGGDSGGPLQRAENLNGDVKFVQYGIVSFGAKTCGKGGVPGVYTRIDYYMDWILDNIRL